MDYRDKIRKLLKLADNPNEHEARAALLKARELMAEHKLTEAECIYAEKQAIKKVLTKWTFTKRRDPWITELSAVISEHYCCVAFREREYRKQVNTLGFVGFEEDVGVCVEIFDFAAKIVRAATKRKKESYRYHPELANELMEECNSYGFGFAFGVRKSFERQKEQHTQEWGLVLTVPNEVREATKDFGNESFEACTKPKASAWAFAEGYTEGVKFNPSHVLKEA